MEASLSRYTSLKKTQNRPLYSNLFCPYQWQNPTNLYFSHTSSFFFADVNPMVLCFRVKFYPTDPMKLKEEITR